MDSGNNSINNVNNQISDRARPSGPEAFDSLQLRSPSSSGSSQGDVVAAVLMLAVGVAGWFFGRNR